MITESIVGTSDTQTQMAWRVADIHAAIAELRARGVRIEEYVAPNPVTTDGVADMGHSWAAWFIDPHRNVLAVVQPRLYQPTSASPTNVSQHRRLVRRRRYRPGGARRRYRPGRCEAPIQVHLPPRGVASGEGP